MTENSKPPEGLSDELVQALRESSDSELREIIDYAQQLFDEHPRLTRAIEPREGEEIVRVADRGRHTTVIVERPDESGEAAGPFAYRVKYEPDIEGGDGRYKWHYLGRVPAEED